MTDMILARNIEEEMKESYLRYSLSVIISRALPDARDGLKPSQRRILFAMRALNLSPGGKHRKCAKICGDTSGDFHPHGETVIYPTLVRMAQEWSMRYRLIDGQGNFGSIDGDPPAAMRYTEARLTTASVQLMEDLDKDTVDYIPNYDETREEPVVFPAKFPNLLCNGSSGIAVGMATNIPPHNLRELVEATLLVLQDREIAIEEIMKVMPAPDFPTGALICGMKGVKEAFHTGRGRIVMRAVITVEDEEEAKPRIVVTELPYAVNKARLVESVADLVNDKQIPGISDVRDESDKDGIRIVFELKRGEMPEVVINQLYKFTDCQTTFGCNMLALDKGLPRIMNVKQLIVAWIGHRVEIVRRRTRFELAKAEARAHILEGYLKAITHLDEVVRIIRESSSKEAAKEALISRFAFSEKQAAAVLDLRLYQLTGLEHNKLHEEYKELLERIAYFQAVLANEEMVKEIIRAELEEILKNNKHLERRTKIVPAEGELDIEDLIADEPVIITISQDDYIKRMPVSVFREQHRGGQGVMAFDGKREKDELKDLYAATTHNTLLIVTTLGRCHWLKVWQLPDTGRRSKGKPLVGLLGGLQEGEKIATVLNVKSFEEEGYIFMTTRKGVVKKTELSAYRNQRKKGVHGIVIDEGDEVIAARLVRPEEQVMLFTKEGMAVRFDESDVRSVGRVSRGVIGIRLRDETDAVVASEVVKPGDTVLVVCENGFGKRSLVDEYRHTKRGGLGVKSIIVSERNGLVLSALTVRDTDSVIMVSKQGQTIRISASELRVLGRNTQGVRLARISEEDLLLAVQKVPAGEASEPEVAELIAEVPSAP